MSQFHITGQPEEATTTVRAAVIKFRLGGRNTMGYNLTIEEANEVIAALSKAVIDAQGGFPPNRELKQGELPL